MGTDENSLFSPLSPVRVGGMHPFFEKASGLTETIIAAAIEVHRDKGHACRREDLAAVLQQSEFQTTKPMR
jgi:hypothetical protein